MVNGAPFGGGILVKGTGVYSTYWYGSADEEILRRIREMERACAAKAVPLAAAALQFSLRDPRITSTIVGVSRLERIEETVALAEVPIPQTLWDVLLDLAAPPDLWQW